MNSSDLKYYRVFGITVCSEIPLPELTSVKEVTPDVTIRLKNVPEQLPKVHAQKAFYQAAKNNFLLKLKRIAYYRIQDDEIHVDPLCSDSSLVRIFLYGPVLGAFLLTRGNITLHASSLISNNKATLICGPTSIGKSSLAMCMLKRGYQIISDDICSIQESETKYYANTGVPSIKIWRDIVDYLNIEEAELKVRNGIEKYLFPIENSNPYLTYQIKNVVYLKSSNINEFNFKEIIGTKKIPILIRNSYRPDYLEGLEIFQKYVFEISKLANNIQLFELTRPSKPLLINDLADYLEARILPNE